MARHPVLLALAFVIACDEPPTRSSAASPEYLAATEMLDSVREDTLDLTYEHPRYQEVLAAFERVPEDAPDRGLAEYWIGRLSGARREASDRRARLAEEAMAPADSYREFLEARADPGPSPEANEADRAPGGFERDIHLRRRVAREQRRKAILEARGTDRSDEIGVDDNGRGPDYWHKRVKALKNKHVTLERDVANQRRHVDRVCFQGPPRSCAHAKVRLSELEQAWRKARDAWQQVKDDARRANAPPGWLRGQSSGGRAPSPRSAVPRRASTEDRDNHGRGKLYWQERKRSLQQRVDRLEEKLASAVRDVQRECAAPNRRTSTRRALRGGRRSPPRVRQAELSDVTYDPEQITVETATRRDCQRAQERHERLKKSLARAQAELDGLKDEARRAGALPGWIR